MTVNDIINALIGKINLCKELNDWCTEISLSQLEDILDLINRQKAEIDRLNNEADRLSQVVLYHDGDIADAIKDFADLSIKRICENVTPIPQQKYLVNMCIQEIENTKKKWLEVVNEKN